MAAKQFFLPYQAATINAVAEPGASLTFYQTQTTTKLPIYTTSLLDTELANPVHANGAGRFADVYLDTTQTYRLVIADRSGNVLDDFDPYTPGTVIGFPSDTDFRVTPQMFASDAGLGTLGLGTQDDSPAFVAMFAYLELQAKNTGGSGFYKGSQKAFIPAGHYYLGTTALDIKHTVVIEGEGSGQFGPQAGGCTRLRWDAATDGIRIQAANTSGNTAYDNVTLHDGSGGVVLRDLCLEGGFDGTTESDHHGLVIRNAVKAYNLYIKNFPGEGVKAWAGNVTGFGTVSGNVSTTLLVGVKTEFNRGGIDIRGADANIVTTINCEGYTNRQFGILDDAGAGANIHIGSHCATNGGYTGTWPQTQCSIGGFRFAAKWGGTFTNAPTSSTVTITIATPGVVTWTAHGLSAGTQVAFSTTGALPTGLVANTAYYVVNTTTNTFQVSATSGGSAINTSGSQSGTHTAGAAVDTADWLSIEAGAAVANTIPAWVNTANTFRAGGDMLTLNSSAAQFVNPYSESGGFSQFNGSTQVDGGTLSPKYFRGGSQLTSNGSDGRVVKAHGSNHFCLDFDGSEAGILARNLSDASLLSYFSYDRGSNTWFAGSGINLAAGVFSVAGTQVVGARQTGWTADTGTARKAANATYAAGTTLTYSAAYVQAEQTAMATRMAAVEAALQNISQTQKALKDAAITHGLIGA